MSIRMTRLVKGGYNRRGVLFSGNRDIERRVMKCRGWSFVYSNGVGG